MQFWQRHLEAIQAEGIAAVEYAARESLPVRTLYNRRKTLDSRLRNIRESRMSAGFQC
jgi:hypothetical protein